MLTVAGFFTSAANLAKASNININLWLGIGMLVLGVLFLLWWQLNPLQRPPAGPAGAARHRDRPVTAPAAPVIVVGVDGSDGSRDAVRWAAEQARLTGAALRAVASWRWPNYVTRIPPGADPGADTLSHPAAR